MLAATVEPMLWPPYAGDQAPIVLGGHDRIIGEQGNAANVDM